MARLLQDAISGDHVSTERELRRWRRTPLENALSEFPLFPLPKRHFWLRARLPVAPVVATRENRLRVESEPFGASERRLQWQTIRQATVQTADGGRRYQPEIGRAPAVECGQEGVGAIGATHRTDLDDHFRLHNGPLRSADAAGAWTEDVGGEIVTCRHRIST